MKNKYIYSLIFSLAALVSACKKETIQVIDDKTIGAQIKFYNFGVGAPGVNIYANTTKVTAIASGTGTESTSGIAYGSVGPLNNYASIEAGQYTFKGTIAAATDKDLAIASLTATLESGKFYSMYLSGLYNTAARSSDAFIVEDKLPAIDPEFAYVRFVNGISTASEMDFAVAPAVGNPTSITIGQNILYKSGSEFVKISEGVYNLVCRNVSSSLTVINRANVSFLKGRVYTISSRGNLSVTTGTAAPFLDNTANR